MEVVLTELIELLTSGISGIATGIGSGLQNLATEMFLKTGTDGAIEGLSTFGGLVAVFGGISLAIGLSTLIFNWVSSLGK